MKLTFLSFKPQSSRLSSSVSPSLNLPLSASCLNPGLVPLSPGPGMAWSVGETWAFPAARRAYFSSTEISRSHSARSVRLQHLLHILEKLPYYEQSGQHLTKTALHVFEVESNVKKAEIRIYKLK
ncbi:hypothetical protein F7725_027874, partial [Dissostichus mawsoni]